MSTIENSIPVERDDTFLKTKTSIFSLPDFILGGYNPARHDINAMVSNKLHYISENGKEKFVYSWRLDHNDATPQGKVRTLSLREMERQIQADLFDNIVSNGGNMTVLELVEKYISTKTGVRPTTKAGYKTVINFLSKDPFGRKRIDTVRLSDAKCWLIKLQAGWVRKQGEEAYCIQ